MKTSTACLWAALALMQTSAARAATRYVDLNSPTPTAPFTDWATAATNIQDAVDAADAGDLILVTNGVYETGGRVVHEALTNRVALTKPVTVQSVNGPEVTIIRGYYLPDIFWDDTSVRCAYLTNGAVLAGFTLTNGATRYAGDPREHRGGGVWCESASATVSNCVLAGNSAVVCGGAWSGTLSYCTLSSNRAFFDGGGAHAGTLNQCTLSGNSVNWYGGGAYDCTLNHCVLSDNKASYGGGAAYGRLNHSTLSGNSTYNDGGGAYKAAMSNCVLSGNLAGLNGGALGGGAYESTLHNCTLIGNSARQNGGGACGSGLTNCVLRANSAERGGGAYESTLHNCTLSGNSAEYGGGGAGHCTLNNCTLSGNSARSYGGGAYWSGLKNCIVYCNAAPNRPDYDDLFSTLNYCCTTPLPTNGLGNFTNAPLFMDVAGGDLRLQSNSPCINAGNNAYAGTTVDMDGNPRIVSGTVDMGAYEYQGPGSVISYAWLQRYLLPTDGSADFIHSDADTLNNWQEWVADTDPTNALSRLRLLDPVPAGADLRVQWESVATRRYFLERSTNLRASVSLSLLATNLAGQAGTTTFTHTNAVGAGPFFYRVGVGN